jgi:hypothetical protein
VCVCVYFMFIFSLFVSDICITIQFTITCSAQNLLLWLINISLPIALRVLLFLTFFEVGKHTTYVPYKPYLGCMLENTATVSGLYEIFTSFFLMTRGFLKDSFIFTHTHTHTHMQ